MKVKLSGSEIIEIDPEKLWNAIIDPYVLKKCIPGCEDMIELSAGEYSMKLNIKVGAVGGSFEGKISLSNMQPPYKCLLNVSGNGSLGSGLGVAKIAISSNSFTNSKIEYDAEGEVGGLVAGVGQRILYGVARHLIKKFFSEFKRHFLKT